MTMRPFRRAQCVLTSCGNSSAYGLIFINEDLDNDCTVFNICIYGLPPKTYHGCHIHVGNDLSKGCEALGGHFNPRNKTHGDINEINSHVGDLGNIYANGYGVVNAILRAKLPRLHGSYNIMDRSIIVHQDPDDLGRGGNRESLTTGNSGKRILAGIIQPRP